MTIKIDKNVPIPEQHYPNKYPWREMEIGDSFIFDNISETAARRHASYHSRNGRKFSCHKVGGDLRCWRVS